MRVETEILYKPNEKSVEIITEDYVKYLVDESYRKYDLINESFITSSLFNDTGDIDRFLFNKDIFTIFYKADCSVKYHYSFKDNCISLKLSDISNFQHFIDNGILLYKEILVSRIGDRIRKSGNKILSLQLFGNALLRDYEYIEEVFNKIGSDRLQDSIFEAMYTVYRGRPILTVNRYQNAQNCIYVSIGNVTIDYYTEFDRSTNILTIKAGSIEGADANRYPIIRSLSVKINN